MQGVWSVWAPSSEKSTLIMVPFIGAASGSVIILMGGGYILMSHGWATLFYLPGNIQIILLQIFIL